MHSRVSQTPFKGLGYLKRDPNLENYRLKAFIRLGGGPTSDLGGRFGCREGLGFRASRRVRCR